MSNVALSHNRQPNILGFMLLAFMLFGLALLVGVALPQVIQNALPGHKEHDEAYEIRNCNTVEAIWINKSCERHTIIKALDEGKYGGQVVQHCRRGWLEISAYIFQSDGKPLDIKVIETILKAKGCTKVAP